MVSSEALKVAAAMLIAMAVFAMLLSLALAPKEADVQASVIGQRMLEYTQNTSQEILKYDTD